MSANPAGFSSFITPPLLLALAYFFSSAKHWRPRAVFLAGMLGLTAIGLTFTRASWAGMVLGIAIIVFLLKRHRMARWTRIGAVMGLIALVGVALLPTMATRLSSDYGSSVNANAAAWEERFGLMRIAFNMIAHHPLLGVGPGAYEFMFREYVPAGLHQWVFTVHNEFLLRAAEVGIPGAIAFIALLVSGFRIGARLLRSHRPEFMVAGIAWIAALTSLVWQMSWVPWRGFSYNAMLWFMFGLADGACRLLEPERVGESQTAGGRVDHRESLV